MKELTKNGAMVQTRSLAACLSVSHLRAFLPIAVLAGCMDGGSLSSGNATDAPLVSASSRFVGAASSQGVNRISPREWGLSMTMEYAQIPTRLEVRMADGPAAQNIRAKGTPIYVYIKPVYQAVRRDVKSGKEDVLNGRVQLPTDNFCDGYRIVLSPQNNYQLTEDFDFKFKIRDQSDGVNAGIFGTIGKNDWEITDIETDAVVVKSARRPFSVDTNSRLYDQCIHPKSRGLW